MPLYALGVNHRTAGAAMRERLVLPAEQKPQALSSLLTQQAVNEAVVLSTCNRTEIYLYADGQQDFSYWLADFFAIPLDELNGTTYQYQDEGAVQHLMRVASGLDSMVLGEPQVLGQIKEAYQLAKNHGSVGRQLTHLFPAVFSVSKEVRTSTAIGAHPVSMAYAVVHLAKRIFTDLSQCRVLLVGAGEMIQLVATHLHGSGVRQLMVANRTPERGSAMARALGAQLITIGEIPQHLPVVDILISATASSLPIIGKGMVERSFKKSKHRPLFMADLAMPRDIEPEVAEIDDVYLFHLDDLQTVLEESRDSRKQAATQAETMVELSVQHYMGQLRVFESAGIIRQFREQVTSLRDAKLAEAMAELQRGGCAATIMARLAHDLSNAIVHAPTKQLRKAAYDGDAKLLSLAKDLFEQME